jgi:hypothetical protein
VDAEIDSGAAKDFHCRDEQDDADIGHEVVGEDVHIDRGGQHIGLPIGRVGRKAHLKNADDA